MLAGLRENQNEPCSYRKYGSTAEKLLANEDFLLSIAVVPAIDFFSLICQELWNKDPEDRVGGIQSSKLILLTS